MRLIGAGFGRSGTMSIKAALEMLGYKPCYHMKIAIYRSHHLRLFLHAWRGKAVNWERFFRRYDAVVDWPACAFYKELIPVYPEAKILLNVRDPEEWYDSMYETIWAIQPAFPWWFPRAVRIIHNEIIWNGNFRGMFEDKEKTIAIYKEWIEEVKRNVPAEKLLVYNVREGWEPLCDFLGVPVPEGLPFPYINERRSFQRVIKLLKVLNWMVPVIVGVLIILLMILIF